MKAVRLMEYGGQLVFNEVATPTMARDEVLVKIKSTAVNHLDLVEASGTARQSVLPGLGCILERVYGRDIWSYRPLFQQSQDAGHTARSCFVWPRHLQRVTYLLAYGWAYCKRAAGPSVFQAS